MTIGFASPGWAATTTASASSAIPDVGRKRRLVEPWNKPSRSFTPSCSTWWRSKDCFALHQNFRGVLLEAGVGWLRFRMERLDEHYELMPRICAEPEVQAVRGRAVGKFLHLLRSRRRAPAVCPRACGHKPRPLCI